MTRLLHVPRRVEAAKRRLEVHNKRMKEIDAEAAKKRSKNIHDVSGHKEARANSCRRWN